MCGNGCGKDMFFGELMELYMGTIRPLSITLVINRCCILDKTYFTYEERKILGIESTSSN